MNPYARGVLTGTPDADTTERETLHVVNVEPVWWESPSIKGVVMLMHDGVTLTVHVGVSARSGQLFAVAPSQRYGSGWLPAWVLNNPDTMQKARQMAIDAWGTWVNEQRSPAR